MILFRPIGLEELILIYNSGLTKYPPRLPEQPIFYPVLNELYATQIARNWNTTSGTFAGYVTQFEIDDAYGDLWDVHQVGAREHVELWIPAETLEEFNQHIVGQITVVSAFFGPHFIGLPPVSSALSDTNARDQLDVLWLLHTSDTTQFRAVIAQDHTVIFAHHEYWTQLARAPHAPTDFDARELMSAIDEVWTTLFPMIPLGIDRAARL